MTEQKKTGWFNPWVIGAATLVLTTVAVNSLLISWSMDNSTSYVDQEYKVKDKKTDSEILANIERQNAMGWQVSIKPPEKVMLNQPATYEISVVDRDGKPVQGELNVMAYRAADANQDFWTEFSEVTPGNYQGAITFPLKGFWELKIRVIRDNEEYKVSTDKLTVLETS